MRGGSPGGNGDVGCGDGRSADREPDRGSVTLASTALFTLMLLLAAVIVTIGQFARQRVVANSAADLAALAAADVWYRGTEDACAAARRVARANGGRLNSCELTGADASVVVAVASPPALRWIARVAGRESADIRAVSRAGPEAVL